MEIDIDKLKEEVERTQVVIAKGQKIVDLVNDAIEKRKQNDWRNMTRWK